LFQPGYFEVQVPANEEKEFAVSFAVDPESQTARKILAAVDSKIEDVNTSLNQELTQQSNILEKFYSFAP